jgi:hypothetical protein
MRSLSIYRYRKLLTNIIYAYFFVLVLQQAGYIFHLPIINKNFADVGLKLNSLSYEASNVATLLPLLMLSYVRTENTLGEKDFTLLEHIKKAPKLWFAFLYIGFTCGASTIFFTFPIFIIFFFRKNMSAGNLMSFILIGVLAVYLVGSFNANLFNRQTQLIPVMFSFDSKKIIKTDASAATRVVPLIEFGKSLTSPDFNLLLGHGVDYAEKFFSNLIVKNKDRKIGAQGMVSFILDYGLIAGILFIAALINFTSKRFFSYETLFYFTCFFVFGFNHYLTWAYLIFMSTNKYFDDQFRAQQNLLTE